MMTMKAWKKRKILDKFFSNYMTVGTTFESATVGLGTIIFTVEPENLKTILATDFQKWDLGPKRRKLLSPLVGMGIFTSDGKAWEHSRVSLQGTPVVDNNANVLYSLDVEFDSSQLYQVTHVRYDPL